MSDAARPAAETLPAQPRDPRPGDPDLRPEPAPGRERYLAELRRFLRARWEAGRRSCVEALLVEYPQLVDDPGAVFQLLIEEYELRAERGEEPTLHEASTRFPSFVKPLAQYLQFQRAVRRGGGGS